jgi:hypothetical protein
VSLRSRPRRGGSLGGGVALEVDGMRLVVDPLVGGRVTSFCLDDFELLSGSAVDPDNYGSTFWTSPQSDWGWPPPAEIDRGPYSVDAGEDTLTLTGAVDGALGVRVVKRFSADRARRAFTLEYDIVNESAKAKNYAPWEVTRVQAGGLTFVPAGSLLSGALALEERGGATWFAHAPADLSVAGEKAFVRGTVGMLAHAARGFLYVKSFEAVPVQEQAPGEAAIEIYANRRYAELEAQGRYARIEPGASASWLVAWRLRELPVDVVAAAGSADLLALAASLAT